MARFIQNRQNIVVHQLQETRYEEFISNVNEWYESLDCNSESYNLRDSSRLLQEEFHKHLDEGAMMYIACNVSTNEMVGTIGIIRPHLCRGKLTSEVILVAVKTEYRQSGISQLLIDEIISVAKGIGVEKIAMVTSYYNKFFSRSLLKKGYELIGTKIEHKSNFTKNMFHLMPDYFVYNYFEKTI